MKTRTFVALCFSWSCVAAGAAAPAPLVVHEWGTFTSFQDADGATISGINVDDEPVPGFVHRLAIVPVFGLNSLPATWSQGAPSCHPDVTLRLETPVLYFYPPAQWAPVHFDVRAEFMGGWLTEYYPAATAEGGGFPKELDAGARGSLTWHLLTLDPDAGALMHQPTSHVWLAPRKVQAAVVLNPESREAEKYHFYRGVGHLDAPLVIRKRQGGFDIALRDSEILLTTLPRIWLVEVLPGGAVIYRTLDAGGRSNRVVLPFTVGGTLNRLPELRRELTEALIAQGLFADEAAAMLDTWRLSYFESEGLRAFFLLPRSWTDARLPLKISIPADVTRVMVGRVELVSAHQRARLAKLHALTAASFPSDPLYAQDPALLRAMARTRGPLSALYRSSGREVPESLKVYESLGRFRDALLIHEMSGTSDETERSMLRRVIDSYSACVPALPKPLVARP